MKIQRLLFWIIALGLISSCAVVEEQIKDVKVVPTQLEKPSADKSFTQESSKSGQQPATVNLASIAKKAEQGDAEAQNQLGLMYQNGEGVTKNYTEAVKWYRKAAEQGYAQAQNNLGLMYVLGTGVTQNNQEAVKWYHKAAAQGDAAAKFNLVILVKNYAQRALRLIKQRQFKQALPFAEKGYHLSKEVFGEKHPNTLASMNDLALIYHDIGRLSEALLLSEKCYRLSKDVLKEKHPAALTSINNLALIYQTIGRLYEALPLFEKGYSFSKKVFGEKHRNTITSMNNLAGIYSNIGRLSKALPLIEKIYHLSQELLGEKHEKTIIYLFNLAVTYENLGRLPKALSLNKKSYSLSQEVLGEKHPYTIQSLINLASIYDAIGRSVKALLLYEKGYRLSQEILGEKHLNTLQNLKKLAYFYIKQGKINKAIKHFEKLVKGVETLRATGDLSAENRQAIFKKWVQSYFWLSDLYIKKSRFKDAFRLTELSKARTLLESLAAKHAAQESGLTKAEQQKLQNYEVRLASFNDQIGKALQDNRFDDRVRLETDKNQLIAELNQFEQKLKAKYPKYAELSEVQIISAKKGAKRLPKNAVMISYLVDGNDVLAFTLESNNRLTAHNLGKIPNIKKDLENYRYRISRDRTRGKLDIRKDKKDTKKLSLELGKRLLEPLKEIIKDKSHWIISPSGALAVIPFETLRLEGEKQPVIAQHQVSYVQSLSILAMLQKRNLAYKRIKKRGNLFAMGAPIYQKAKTVSKQAQPSSTDVKIARGLVQKNDSTRALRQLDLHWQNLPGTLKELSELKKVFSGATVYKQKQATESKLQSLNQQRVLEKYRYLVFSAHGFLSPDIPALSSVVLGQVDNPKGIDGYVTAGEWPGYDLKSDLMVLSACETGLGEVVGGEGILGLPYALFVAGNKNTLLTLWSISDEVTTEFMISFFRKLKGGQGQIEALTATKREFLNKGKPYNNPVYWAAFVLYGV
jgi:CHAT domain-containing protein/TPR repeat protein